MSFKAGQQVVCISDRRGKQNKDTNGFSLGPSKNELVTIDGLWHDECGLFLYIKQYPVNSNGDGLVYHKRFFRPLSEINISQIESILEVKKEGTKTD